VSESHLVSGLKQSRGVTMGRLADYDRQLEMLQRERDTVFDSLGPIDAVLVMLEPSIKLEAIKARRPKGSCVSTRGDGRRVPITQAILKLLHRHDGPLTVSDVVQRLRNDYPSADERKLAQNVRVFLSKKKNENVLRALKNDRGVLGYSFIARSSSAAIKQAA
jgi:hypothetical protein